MRATDPAARIRIVSINMEVKRGREQRVSISGVVELGWTAVLTSASTRDVVFSDREMSRSAQIIAGITFEFELTPE